MKKLILPLLLFSSFAFAQEDQNALSSEAAPTVSEFEAPGAMLFGEETLLQEGLLLEEPVEGTQRINEKRRRNRVLESFERTQVLFATTGLGARGCLRTSVALCAPTVPSVTVPPAISVFR